ncbi:hypothetical protein [Streptomyces sp. B6B3]|uniref:hypothetical protein n=1 Tax=Streptomyces sp. B6B3 TaxID=3153570 RepID=UPI00325C4CC1
MSHRPTTTSPSFPNGETPALRALAEHLTAIADADGLAHLILYDRGTVRIAVAAGDPDDADDHARNGRQLYFTLGELGPDLAQLRSGVLMRTIIQVPTGAIFFFLVGGDVHLYGATQHAEHTDELDRLMARAANGIRRDWRYSELDFGSYLSVARNDGAAAGAPGPPAATAPDDRPGGADAEPDGGPLAPLAGALSATGLHHVAYHQPGRAEVVTADVFDDPALEEFFAFLSRDERRAQYRILGERLPGLANWLNTALWAVTGGEAIRLVLDVELGALYLFALPDNRYLVGVTLDQTLVEVADRAMQRLTAELTRRLGPAPR